MNMNDATEIKSLTFSVIKNKLKLGMELDNKFRIESGAGSLVKALVGSGFGLVGV